VPSGDHWIGYVWQHLVDDGLLVRAIHVGHFQRNARGVAGARLEHRRAPGDHRAIGRGEEIALKGVGARGNKAQFFDAAVEAGALDHLG
jgi:hypothetical protein